MQFWFLNIGMRPGIPKDFDFNIFLFALLISVCNCLWGTIKNTNKSELLNCSSFKSLPYLFKVGSLTFRNFNLDCPLTSMASKRLCQIFQKKHQIAAFLPTIDITYIIYIMGLSKFFFQTCVIRYVPTIFQVQIFPFLFGVIQWFH